MNLHLRGFTLSSVEVVADLPFEVLPFWDSRPGSKKVKVISVPSAQIKETDTKRRPTVRLWFCVWETPK